MNDGTSTTGATGTTEVAGQKARDVATSTAEQAKGVADVAKEQAHAVAGDAATQVRHVTERTKSELRSQADERAAQMSETLRDAARQLQKMAENSGESGMVVDLSRDAGQRIQSLAQRIDQGGVDRIVADVKAAARRRPGTFLVGAAVAGFAAARLLRDAQSAESDDRSDRHEADQPYVIPEPRDFLASDPAYGDASPVGSTVRTGATGSGMSGTIRPMGSGVTDRPLGDDTRNGGL